MSNFIKQWACNYKINDVFVCPRGCDKKHEHYIGSYEQALKYFIGEEATQEKEKSTKSDLYNVVIHHQLSENVMTKTSSELYSILLRAASTKKYWVPEEERHGHILALLEKAKEGRLLHDEGILEECEKEDAPQRMKNRLYRHNKWLEMIYYK